VQLDTYIYIYLLHQLQTEAEKAQLKCWYESKTHPYWTIQPIKKEALSLDPELYQMYDLLSPGAIKFLIEKSEPQMERSLTWTPSDPTKKQIIKERTSRSAFLNDTIEPDRPKPDEKFAAIGKLIEYSSGLNVLERQAGEKLQVASYGGSHHYDEHYDAVRSVTFKADGNTNRSRSSKIMNIR